MALEVGGENGAVISASASSASLHAADTEAARMQLEAEADEDDGYDPNLLAVDPPYLSFADRVFKRYKEYYQTQTKGKSMNKIKTLIVIQLCGLDQVMVLVLIAVRVILVLPCSGT